MKNTGLQYRILDK